ncbi:MAG: excisionase family DNA-binding protein [Ilumatobacteraceae bacterium]
MSGIPPERRGVIRAVRPTITRSAYERAAVGLRAAERLNVPVRLVLEKRIPYLKVGRYVRFDAEDVDAWLVTNETPQLNFTTSNDRSDMIRRNPGSAWR